MKHLGIVSSCFLGLGFLELLGYVSLWFSLNWKNLEPFGRFSTIISSKFFSVLFLLSLSSPLGILMAHILGHLRLTDDL